jgi:hypothetical protein
LSPRSWSGHRALRFYLELGFALLRDGGDFVALTWEEGKKGIGSLF